jgi:hypothetical protein
MKRLALLVSIVGALACGSGQSCTEIACENDATVSYSGMTIQGAYDLVIESAFGTFMARCSDPGSPELADNDPEVQCTASGFELTGDAAIGHSVFVTILPVEGDPAAESVEVFLNAVETHAPNGEDCEPVCYSRTGQLIF